MLKFGCIADDFTGASDAASFLVKGGMAVQLINGIPGPDMSIPEDIEGVVIALKSRTQPVEEAVKDSISALDWLRSHGARQFYFKYCSTFDSTRKGNIGPVADASMELLSAEYTILCPGLPVNGRTVKDGDLYVDGIPLHKSHMKDHPLTPMWDCSIARLMAPQSKYPALEIHSAELGLSLQELDERIAAFRKQHGDPSYIYIIPDYRNDKDAEEIVRLFGDNRLLTGGSGILTALAAHICGSNVSSKIPDPHTSGGAILLAGSCSAATLRQIENFQKHGGLSIRISPEEMLEGTQDIEKLWSFIADHRTESVLVYSSDLPENVRRVQALGKERIASLLEETEAELALRALKAGMKRIIVAGGETSGAVTRRLGFSSYRISRSVAPGVPVMIPSENDEVRLVLKSGNFGQPDFFLRALDMTGEQNDR